MIQRIVLTLVLLTTSALAHSGIVYISPANQVANIGDEVSISILGSNFDATKPIEGGGINLTFNSGVLELKNVTVDAITWEFFTTSGEIDNSNGTLDDLTFSSFAGRSGGFSIAQITFQALSRGSSLLTLTESALNPFASGGELLNPAVSLSSAEITVVPLPAAFWLFLSGLSVFGVFRQRHS